MSKKLPMKTSLPAYRFSNDPKDNSEVAEKLQALRDRASQQPVSYIQPFRDAMELADDLFHRAMCAEAEVARLRTVVQAIEAEALRYAGMYPQSSDGHNTFVLFAARVDSLAHPNSP